MRMANASAREPAILVTGGAGFIGTALSEDLLRLGPRVIAIDDLIEQVHPGRTRPEGLPEAVELVQADVARPGQSLTESTRHAMTNVVGTSAMLDAFVRHEAMPDHLVLTSSRAVYGEGSWRTVEGHVFYPQPRSHAQLERGEWDHRDASGVPAAPVPMTASQTHPSPSSIYGSTKLAQEMVLRNWASAFSVPLSVLRLQNVYGPGQSPHNPYTGIVTLFHRLASRGETLDVYEDGDIGRDFVFIDDVVSALRACIAAPPNGETPRVLDVGTGTVTTILDAARTIAAMYGAPEPVVSGKFRDGDVRHAVAEITRTRDELQWSPEWTFAAGSAALSDWLKQGGFLG